MRGGPDGAAVISLPAAFLALAFNRGAGEGPMTEVEVVYEPSAGPGAGLFYHYRCELVAGPGAAAGRLLLPSGLAATADERCADGSRVALAFYGRELLEGRVLALVELVFFTAEQFASAADEQVKRVLLRGVAALGRARRAAEREPGGAEGGDAGAGGAANAAEPATALEPPREGEAPPVEGVGGPEPEGGAPRARVGLPPPAAGGGAEAAWPLGLAPVPALPLLPPPGGARPRASLSGDVFAAPTQAAVDEA